jgi:hypothetical protein
LPDNTHHDYPTYQLSYSGIDGFKIKASWLPNNHVPDDDAVQMALLIVAIVARASPRGLTADERNELRQLAAAG